MQDFNISSQFLRIFQMLYEGILFCFEFLRSIKISGDVSLLSISVAVVLIGTFLPMIIGLVSTGYRSSRSDYRARSRSRSRSSSSKED